MPARLRRLDGLRADSWFAPRVHLPGLQAASLRGKRTHRRRRRQRCACQDRHQLTASHPLTLLYFLGFCDQPHCSLRHRGMVGLYTGRSCAPTELRAQEARDTGIESGWKIDGGWKKGIGEGGGRRVGAGLCVR